MPRLGDDSFESLALGLESERCERKETFKGDAPTKVREAVCAFANDLPGHRQPGVVVIGLRDDGSPKGLQITDELLRSLGDIKTDGNIVPPPTLSVEKRTLRGVEVAAITVWPSDSPPVRYQGKIWIRSGPRRALASAQDERVLNERRRYKNRPFDVQPIPGATLADLDRRRFELEYLPASVAPEVLAANGRSLEQQLASTKMVVTEDLPEPTVLGLLVIGVAPCDFLFGAYVQFLRVDGEDLTGPIVDEERVAGSVGYVVRTLEEKFVAHNRVAVDFVSSAAERRKITYPEIAFQQLFRNAILHRSYESNAPVRVTWYNDRIEITSPGGPYGEATEHAFGLPGVTDYRNPNLAEAMKALGLVQKFGAGISVSKKAMETNGNPALEFRFDGGFTSVTLRKAP